MFGVSTRLLFAACQKQDWKHRHKQFCPQFQKVNKYDKEVVGDKAMSLIELSMHQSIRKTILQSDDPAQYEPCSGCCDSIIKNEVLCEVCHRTPYQAPTYKAFAACTKCRMVRYCSDTCKDALSSVHFSEDCATLNLLFATERTQIDYHIARKTAYRLQPLMTPSIGPRRMHTPLARYTDFIHLHRELSEEFTNIAALTKSFPTSHPMAVQAVGQMSMEAESIPLTVIAGLEASIPDIATRSSLEIHIVAASSRELNTRGMTEEILHHFPALRKLQIHYIGPEAIDRNVQSATNRACAACKARGSSRTWAVHPMEYHCFVDQNPSRRPDLIVGLNTGWSEVATGSWSTTLDTICAFKIPTLFTAYTQNEARREVDLLRNRGVDFIVDDLKTENKWRGVIPTVNKGMKLAHGTLAAYNSRYWYVFQGR
ncbi:hypothetical protein C8R44DRAFT_872488 [Mycena epipterygia]|nr:hypothetical protein C8R44DRAFT_872488 [Mycena epipterygia]